MCKSRALCNGANVPHYFLIVLLLLLFLGACADCKLFEDIMNKPMKKKKDVISSIVGLFKPGDAKIKPVASTPQKLER